MAEKPTESKPSVPYIPFKTFKAFIEKLNSTAVPSTIDRSILTNLSGSMRGSLMSALKALAVTDNNGHVKDEFRNLIKAYKTGAWGDLLGDIVIDAYSDVIGDVDLDTGTMAQLNEAFRLRGNVDGQMREKAIRFYLQALKESGITYSPHFRERKPRKKVNTVGRKKVPHRSSAAGVMPPGAGLSEAPPPGIMRISIPIPGKADGALLLPDDLTKQEWQMVKDISAFILETYIKSRGGSSQ